MTAPIQSQNARFGFRHTFRVISAKDKSDVESALKKAFPADLYVGANARDRFSKIGQEHEVKFQVEPDTKYQSGESWFTVETPEPQAFLSKGEVHWTISTEDTKLLRALKPFAPKLHVYSISAKDRIEANVNVDMTLAQFLPFVDRSNVKQGQVYRNSGSIGEKINNFRARRGMF